MKFENYYAAKEIVMQMQEIKEKQLLLKDGIILRVFVPSPINDPIESVGEKTDNQFSELATYVRTEIEKRYELQLSNLTARLEKL